MIIFNKKIKLKLIIMEEISRKIIQDFIIIYKDKLKIKNNLNKMKQCLFITIKVIKIMRKNNFLIRNN